MFSPTEGDARASAPPNARDSSSSMPSDHSSAWDRPHYARSDRGDRDRLLPGKRDAWALDRASAAPSYHRASGLSSTNGSPLGPPSKRRPPGRHTFYGENGRHGTSRTDPSPGYGGASPIDNGAGRKADRDAYYSSGSSSILGTSTGYNASIEADHRSKDADERHSRESYVQSGDGRESASSAIMEQLARPYHSQVFSECNNSWDRDGRPRSSSISGWDVTQRGDREHRDRLRGKPDMHRRSGSFSQFDTGSWHGGDRDLDARPDRYNGSTRETLFSDSSNKDPVSTGHEWKLRDRPATSGASARNSGLSTTNGMLKDSLAKQPGVQDGTLPLLSPQQSPFSSPTSVSLDGGRDDGGFSSPRKRPRLGWGQGLAKYEKKKVIEREDVVGALASAEGETLDPYHSPCDKVPSPVAQVLCARPMPSMVSVASDIVDGNNEVCFGGTGAVGVEQVVALQGLAEKASCKQVLGNVAAELLEFGELGPCAGPVLPTPLDPVKLADNIELSVEMLGIRSHRSAKVSEMPSRDGSPVLDGQQKVGAGKESLILSCKRAVNVGMHLLKSEAAALGKDMLATVPDFVGDCLITVNDETLSCIEQHGAGCNHGLGSPREISAAGAKDTSLLAMAEAPPGVDGFECESAIVVKEVVVAGSPGYEGENLVEPEAFVPIHDDTMESVEPNSADGEYGGVDTASGRDCVGKGQSILVVEEGQEVIASSLCTEVESRAQPATFFKPSRVKEEIREDHDSSIRAVLLENKQAAFQASKSLSHLLPHWPDVGNEKLYSCPVEASVWQTNVLSHDRVKHQLREKLLERKRCCIFKERALAIRYRALKEVWCREQLGLCQRRDRPKIVRRVEVDRRNGTSLCQRTSSRLRLTPSGAVRPDALSEEVQVVKRLMSDSLEQARSVERMPTMILDERDRFFQMFVTKNGLVEDPVSVERERRHVNPWTDAEKKVFLDKYALHCKNFRKIAMFLEHKTTADCVEFYYRNQKSEDFEKIHRKQQLKKRRDYSRSSASYLATTMPPSSSHREANAVRVEALTMAVASASAAALVPAGGREPVKSVRAGPNKSADRGKSIGLDMVTCESLPSVRSVGAKESKAASSLLAVAAGTPGFGTNSCSLSSAASLPKSCRERYNLKGGVAVGSSMQNVNADHSVGCKGVRSMQVRRESMKATSEETESQWTEQEKQLFRHAVATAGKNFKVIALQVGTKTQGQCRAFFSKTHKRLGLDQPVDQVESTMAVLELATVGGKASAEVESGNIEDFVKEALDVPVTEAQAMDIDTVSTAQLEKAICGSIACKEEAANDIAADHKIGVEADGKCAPTPAVHVEEVCGVVESAAGARKGAIIPTDDTTVISAPDLSSEAELNPKDPHPPSQEAEVVAKDEPAPDDSKVCESVVTKCPTWVEGVSKDALDNPSAALNSESSSASKLELKICQALVKPDPESPSTGVSFVNEPVFVQQGRPVTVQLASTVVPMPPVHIMREKVSRSGMGESKPRREPTSWTQEEKEKFAEIIRNHGKDWTLLHESLPAKSLTQIKTYFQNSKAKLGFAPPEGTGAGSRGGGSRKRKADDSDTSSNAGSGGAVSHHKGSGVVDELSLKVNPGSAGVASAENLAFALFGRSGGQTPEESVSNLQKLLRQMCTPNGYASQAGLFPLPVSYHPVFAPQLQRVAQLSLQQQQLTSSQPLGLQQPGVSQSILHAQLQQQQTVMVRKHQIQQQHASQIMAHQQVVSQLQQQVSQGGHLHQHSVQHAMQAQTAHCQQALHGQVQVQASVQSPTASLSQSQQVQQQHQVSQKQMAAGSSVIQQQQTHLRNFTHNQQHPNQLLHLQSQVVQGLPPSSRQHQHFQQATQKHQDQSTNHVSSLQLQQQLQQVGKLQLQKHIQAVQQGQSQQQQSGGQPQLHHSEQQQVEQQQVLQQLHQGEQGLLREVMQVSTSHSTADVNGEVELRSAGSLLRQLVRAGEVQNTGQICSSCLPVTGKGHDQVKNGGPCSEGLRPGDVKLFGQSLLSQPSSGPLVQPSVTVRAFGTSNSSDERPAVLQGTVFASSTSGQSVAGIQPSVSSSKASCFKELGPVSSFGRVGASVENRQPNWPSVLAGNLGMWSNMLSSAQVGGSQLSGDSETQGVQEVALRMADRFSREVRDSEDTRGVHVTDTMASLATLPGKLQHIDHLRGIQAEVQRNEALAGTVQASDQTRGNALIDQGGSHLGVGAGDLLSRAVEAERANDAGSQMSSLNGSGERPSSAAVMQCRSGHACDFGVASLSSLPSLNGLQASGGLQGTGQTAAIPRQVLDALMKIAEWHNRTVQCAAAAAAAVATNAAQARSGGSNDAGELHPTWAGEHGLRREPHGGSSTISSEVDHPAAATKPSAALGAAAAATMGQTHLVTVPEVLQHVRDCGMYFGPTTGHLMQLAGTGHVSNPGSWLPAISTAPGGGLHPASSSDSQQRILLQPIISSFRSPNLPWGPSGADEHLRPCSSESSARDSSVDHHTSS